MPIIIAEAIGIIGLPAIHLNSFCFGWGCSYDQSIFAAAILIAIGQTTLLIANIKESSPVRLIALGFLLYGFLFLCHNFDNTSGFTFTVSFPFLIVVCLLIFKLLRKWQYNRSLEKIS
ncbi:hypothetical protein FPZ43_10535 [Mucilaginibacter pallidiroseus]|uniref:Uncharacterized protein n=1 Tax=Mucilaginibacter pallidiroseus TaxID=2599295 RepID=A0A563UDB6_9SPHI|nr:hypothetical protein [Mucilaginibacter pallidiroseus]TWR29382.1 hypothetical protein FPZ43_10535 [Mucilaginibacter pallidiroseus]